MAQSLSGLQPGDEAKTLEKLKVAPSAGDTYKAFTLRKFQLPNGNDLSITLTAGGKIAYLESDWNGGNRDPQIDLPGLKFGVTTLTELRKRMGSNGFGFKKRDSVIREPDGVVMLNSYEVGNVVVTFVTKVDEDEYRQRLALDNSISPADCARLDAVSLATIDYANSEWGERILDPAYHPPAWK